MKLSDLQDSMPVLEAARAAGLHPSTLSRAIRRGDLEHLRVLGRIRIRPADLERFLSRTYQPRTEAGRRD